MKKSERLTQESNVRKTGSNPLVRKPKASTAKDQSNDVDGEPSLVRQSSVPFVLTGSKNVRKTDSNPQLKSAVIAAAELQVESSPPATAEDTATMMMKTASVRSAQSALPGAASKLQVPSAGPSSPEDALLSSSSKAKLKTNSKSIKFNASALLGQSPSRVEDSSPKTVPSSVITPSESNMDKTISGAASARSIKSTLIRVASTKPPGAASTILNFDSTSQDTSGQNEKPNTELTSLKSIQPFMKGQAPSKIAGSSQQGSMIVLSDNNKKFQSGSRDYTLTPSGSKQSKILRSAKDGPTDTLRKSETSLKKTSQQLADMLPDLEGRPSLHAYRQSASRMGVGDSSFSMLESTTSKNTTSKFNDSIRLLASKISNAKMDSRAELDLETRMEMCPCPAVEGENEDEYEEERQFLESIRSSIRSKQSSRQYQQSIRTVKRSPYERKDRAARQEFLNELELMEIAEIKKKQKLKPRNMKKYLKKEGVYQTIKSANFIPDSQSDGSRGHPPVWSIGTYSEGVRPEPSPSASFVSPEDGEEDRDLIDRFQLRKEHHSVGSRLTGQFLKEEAFLEIELSEVDDVDPTPRSLLSPSSSSATEALSSSSEISLRVNLEKAHLRPAEKKKVKIRNAPYLTYKNKIDAEIQAAAKKSSHEGSSQENLIIEKIATEFGEWAKDNGLKPEAVEKDIIKELFQFGTMDTAANSIAVEIKELVIVPETITEGLYPELEERAALYRQIMWDEMAYWKKERSMAFGKPDPFPYKRPSNEPLPLWTKSGFVPLPLSTGELLYQTLIDNESMMLERYVLWLVENPKYHRPPYLIKRGYFQKIVDKHGGKEDVIRHKSQAAKHLVNSTGKSLAGLNIGMKTELRKLKEMAKADITVHSTRNAR